MALLKVVSNEKVEAEEKYVVSLNKYGTQFDLLFNMYMQKMNSNMVQFYSKNTYYSALRMKIDYNKP